MEAGNINRNWSDCEAYRLNRLNREESEPRGGFAEEGAARVWCRATQLALLWLGDTERCGGRWRLTAQWVMDRHLQDCKWYRVYVLL